MQKYTYYMGIGWKRGVKLVDCGAGRGFGLEFFVDLVGGGGVVRGW